MKPSESALDLYGPVGAALALIGCALFALSIPAVPDHGYQFYLAEQMLSGARLYVDIAAADMHPPLFTWMALALTALGKPIGASGLSLYPAFVVLLVAATMYALWRMGLRDAITLVFLVIALLPLSGPYFGQGEHLALIAALPYLYAAVRAEPVPRRTGISSAIFAALGLAMKPHFALVWVGVELLRAGRHGWKSLFRAESLVIGALFVLYVAATTVLHPQFFPLLPWLMELYPRFAPVPFSRVLFDQRTLLFLAGLAAAFMVRSSERKDFARALAIASVAMFLAVLLQKKGWGYHWYPVNALAVLLIGIALRDRIALPKMTAPILAVLAIVWMQFVPDRTARLMVGPPAYLPEMLEFAEQQGAGQSIQILTHLLNPAFPLVNYGKLQWASPYAHLWMIPAIYEDTWYRGAPVHYRDAGKWAPLEQQMFDRLWQQVERRNPLLLVQVPFDNGFDTRAYFETDPRFRDRFARAPVLDTIGRYIVFGRL